MIFKRFLSLIALFALYSNPATAGLVVDIAMVPSQQYVTPGSTADLFIDFTVSPSSTEVWDPSLVSGVFSGGTISYYDATDSMWYGIDLISSGEVFVTGHTTSIGTFDISTPSQYYPTEVVGIGDTVQIKWGSFTLNSLFEFDENDKINILEDYFIDFTGGGSIYAGSGTWDIATTSVPVPGAIWLFGSGLLGLAGMAKRKKS